MRAYATPADLPRPPWWRRLLTRLRGNPLRNWEEVGLVRCESEEWHRGIDVTEDGSAFKRNLPGDGHPGW